MGSLEIIIKEYDVPDDTKTIREDTEFIGVAEIPTRIILMIFCIGLIL